MPQAPALGAGWLVLLVVGGVLLLVAVAAAVIVPVAVSRSRRKRVVAGQAEYAAAQQAYEQWHAQQQTVQQHGTLQGNVGVQDSQIDPNGSTYDQSGVQR